MVRLAWLLILGLALIVGAITRAEAPRKLHPDEAVSFLAAMCKERSYAELRERNAPPFARWEKARVWQSFLQEPGSKGCLREISRGLTKTDFHPPLYFWLLHFWLLAFPPSLATGLSLNALFALGTGAALYGLAREVLGGRLVSALAVLAWAANPYGIAVSQLARPYELFGFVSVLFLWRCARWAHAPPSPERVWRERALLFLCALAGVLTHYQFVLVIAAAGVYLSWSLGPSRALGPGLCALAAFVASNAFHPTLQGIFSGRPERFVTMQLTSGVKKLAGKSLAFFDYRYTSSMGNDVKHVLSGALVLVALALLAGLLVRHHRSSTPPPDWRFLVVPALLLTATAAGVFYELVPVHAWHQRYMPFLWPLFGLAACYPLTLLRLTALPSAALSCIAAIGLSWLVLRSLPKWSDAWRHPPPAILDGCQRVVVPHTNRVFVLYAVFGISPETPVFAGTAPELDRALSAVPVPPVCVASGDQRQDALRVLAMRNVPVVRLGH